jgi:hypothetical protein
MSKQRRLTASEQRAQHFTEHRRQREHEEQQRRDAVIAEFNGDLQALANEIVHYRHCVRQLADAVEWTKAGHWFIAFPPGPYRRSRTENNQLDARPASR